MMELWNFRSNENDKKMFACNTRENYHYRLVCPSNVRSVVLCRASGGPLVWAPTLCGLFVEQQIDVWQAALSSTTMWVRELA